MFPLPCMLVCAYVHFFGTRDRGCSAHPAFPAPSFRRGANEFAKARAKHAARTTRLCFLASFRAKRSNPSGDLATWRCAIAFVRFRSCAMTAARPSTPARSASDPGTSAAPARISSPSATARAGWCRAPPRPARASSTICACACASSSSCLATSKVCLASSISASTFGSLVAAPVDADRRDLAGVEEADDGVERIGGHIGDVVGGDAGVHLVRRALAPVRCRASPARPP